MQRLCVLHVLLLLCCSSAIIHVRASFPLPAPSEQKGLAEFSTQLVSNYIEENFASLSYEVSGVLGMTGKVPNLKSSFIQLMNNMRHTPNAPGVRVRVGGNSADESWWDPSGLPNPPNVTYDITSIDLLSVNASVAQFNGSLVLDVNFRQADNASWAINHVCAISQYIGWSNVRAIEIGNECDVYTSNGIRPPDFDYQQYQSQWESYATQLYARCGMPPRSIQGATFCCGPFDSDLDGYMKAEANLLYSTSYHRYPLSRCGGSQPTLAQLMEDSASAGVAESTAGFIAHAEQLELPGGFWIGESNSVSCGGQPNVSDVMGAALWATDYLLNMAAVNARGVNFHGGVQGAYSAITYSDDASNQPIVHPLYYAMYLISYAVRGHVAVANLTWTTDDPLVKAWQLAEIHDGGDGSTGDALTAGRLVIIHKNISANAQKVNVELSSFTSASTALLYRLTAPDGNPYAPYGLNFSGLTFDGNSHGQPVGSLNPEKLTAASPGVFYFTVDPVSIVLVDLQL